MAVTYLFSWWIFGLFSVTAIWNNAAMVLNTLFWCFCAYSSVGYIGYIFQRKIWWHVCVCRYIFQRKIDGIYVGLCVCVLKISFQLNFVMQRTDIQFSLSSHTFGFRCISTWMIFHVLQTSFTFKHTLSFYLRCVCHTQFFL